LAGEGGIVVESDLGALDNVGVEPAGRAEGVVCASIISSNCFRIATCASALAYVGWVLFNNGFSSLGFPKMAIEIFLVKPGATGSRGSSPMRCFSRLFSKNSLISSTSSGMGMS
jgi:hypothetical protein